MRKKLFYVSCLLMVLCLASASRAELMAYYGMEEGAGTLVADGSGKGHDGTITGTPTWVPGQVGNALQFGVGGNGVVNCGTWDTTAPNNAFTAACWVKFGIVTGSAQYQGLLANRTGQGAQNWGIEVMGASGSCYFGAAGNGGVTSYGLATLPNGTWAHFALSCDGATTRTYLNGALVNTNTGPRFGLTKNSVLRIGSSEGGGNVFQGVIDEVYIFNEILSLDDIVRVMNGEMSPGGAFAGYAKGPQPANNSTEVSIDVGKITWVPGAFAVKHNVFWGTNFDDVNTATLANPLSTTVFEGLDVNTISLSRLPYATTYYWRVDEVNAPSKPATYVGKTWNFKTELQGYPLVPANIIKVTAVGGVYPEQDPNSTANRKGLDANDMHSTATDGMWVGMGEAPGTIWIQYEFDKIYMFHDMLVWNYNEESPGEMFGAKDVNVSYSIDGNNWTGMPKVTLNPATGDNTATANTTVELNQAIGKFIKITFLTSYADMDVYGLSEVRFSAEPTRVLTPTPANNATNQAINAALKWKPGRYAVEHNLYISTDANAVNGVGTLVAPITLSDANAIPGLDLNKRYYWRVDEVNMANAFTTWDGPVWALTTTSSLLIDGFTTTFYGATEVNYVWATWKDGLEVPANGGSIIGKDIAPPGLSTVNQGGGGGSIKVDFDNSGANALSQVTAQSVKLPIGRTDWSIGNPTTLTIWFRGEPNTVVASDELFCTIGGKTSVYGGNLTNYLKGADWRQWDIDLASLGANLSNIPQLTIGIRKAGATGGKGAIYLDNIQLTGVAAVIAKPTTWIEAENANTLTAPMIIATGTLTPAGWSGTGYIWTESTAAAQTTAPPTVGIATYTFTITNEGQYRIGFRTSRPNSATNDSLFVKVTGPSVVMDRTLDPIQQNWANMNGITRSGGGAWRWGDVFDTAVANVITYTFTPGTYTLQIAHRESQVKIDAIEIRPL